MKKISLSNKILIGMVLGAVTGLIVGERIEIISIVGDVFLRLLRMAVVPLIFSNVIVAVGGMGDLKRLGKIGVKLIVIFLATTLIAATIGLGAALIIRPGAGFVMDVAEEVAAAEAPTFYSVVLGMFPTNIMQSFSEANMLQVIVFAIIAGISIMLMKKEDQDRLLGIFGMVSRFIMSILRFVMGFTPYGVFALMAVTTGKYGASIFGPLGKFILTVYAGLLVHAFVVYGGMYFSATKKGAFKFFKTIAPVWTTSFSTCSTAATIPVSLRVCEEDLKLKKDISNFCIPVGATMNMDGNGLWFGVVAVFVAQSLGMQMTFAQMITAVLLGVLMTLGSPGIPGGIFVATTIFLTSMNMPIEFVGLLAGVFRIMDMGITTVNVVGSVAVAAVVDASDKDSNELAANAV